MKVYRLKIYLIVFMILMLVNIPSYANNREYSYLNGTSGILIERDSGRILYSKNSNLKLPMASTTKIMTALVALEKGNLDDIVKIKSNSVGIEGSSIYLRDNEEITLKDLIYGLMLRSGNDAAVAIANHIGGSVEGFSKLMNKKAKEIGANNTNFTNPHGLHNDNHYTTAYDLALITREALKNEEFNKIAKSKYWVADRDVNNYFSNKNKTLWQYEGGDGVKIGYTKKAGRCLVASATRNNMQLIAVVLNDYNWFNDCYQLFDYGFENYDLMVIFDKKQFVKSIQVINGKEDTLPLLTKDRLVMPLTKDEMSNIKTVLNVPDKVSAPINSGDNIGSIKVYLKGQLIFTQDLISRDTILEKGIFEKTLDKIKSIFK